MARKRDDSKGLSIRAYAEHRKALGIPGSRKAVEKALRDGRIRPNAAGKLDPQQADRDWAESTAPRVFRGLPDTQQSADSRVPPADHAPADTGARTDRTSYAQSRAVREDYDARMRKLDYETKLGRMVLADDVKLEAFQRARSVRDRMMGIPARIAGTLAEETDPHVIEQRLLEAIALALETEASEP